MKQFKIDKCTPLHQSVNGYSGCPFARDNDGAFPVLCTYHFLKAFIAVDYDLPEGIPECCPLEESEYEAMEEKK